MRELPSGPIARFGLVVDDAHGGARRARHALVDRLRQWRLDEDAIDTIALLASEVLTNALRHAAPRQGDDQHVALRVLRYRQHIRVEVDDPDSTRPTRAADQPPLAETGRGLHILDRLTKEWGVAARPPGKTIWFVVTPDPAE